MMLRRLLPRAANAGRFYSTSKLSGIDPSQLSITKTTTLKELTPQNELVFGKSFTDHMLSCEWTASEGESN
jgi:branched-chain amino acid aminotransferase